MCDMGFTRSPVGMKECKGKIVSDVGSYQDEKRTGGIVM